LWRLGGAVTLILLAAGCGGNGTERPAGFDVLNVAVADEPRAALIGRDVLRRGGNAADAVTAMALTMAVTLPSRVGPGAGGACLVHDPAEGSVRALQFLPGGDGAPGFLRGLFSLHGAHGTLRWAELIGSAENLARFGHPMSRALARDAAAAPDRAPPPLGGTGGAPAVEGTTVEFPALAATLGRVRRDGVGAFYEGDLARQVAEGAAEAGQPLTVQALRAYRPAWTDTIEIEVGNDLLHFAPAPGVSGPVQQRLWAGGAEAAAAGAPVLPGGASAAAVSADEMAVACGFGMGALFGSGAAAGDTGVLLAAPAPPGRPLHGGVAVVVNEPLARALLAAGGAAAAAALAVPLRERLRDDRPPADALAGPRGPGDRAGPEAPADAGRGVLIGCAWDRGETKTCRGAADPRGFGLAAGTATGG